jgi:DNA (cytosine-5)-methyltransferase 1
VLVRSASSQSRIGGAGRRVASPDARKVADEPVRDVATIATGCGDDPASGPVRGLDVVRADAYAMTTLKDRHDGAHRRPSAVSLFSGCGGSDLALTRSGFNVKWANDVWSLACSTYRDNIDNARIHEGDVRDFERFPSAQLLVGCYPCQGYSQGGKRAWLEEPTNYLYQEFDRALRYIQPRAFVVENVNGMAYGANRTLLANQLKRYRLAGYRVQWSVLDAKEYGVAQTRRRVFIVGIRADFDEVYKFPEGTHGPNRSRGYVSQRTAIGRMPIKPEGKYCPDPLHWYYLSRNRRHEWDEPAPCIVGHWRSVPLHPASPRLRKVDRDWWTFSTKGSARRLSYEECARLQGFPASWRWRRGSLRHRFQMIGNAVPPPLFEAVVRALPPIWG